MAVGGLQGSQGCLGHRHRCLRLLSSLPAVSWLRLSPSGNCAPQLGSPCVSRKTTIAHPSGASSPSPACPQCSVGRWWPQVLSTPHKSTLCRQREPYEPRISAHHRARYCQPLGAEENVHLLLRAQEWLMEVCIKNQRPFLPRQNSWLQPRFQISRAHVLLE